MKYIKVKIEHQEQLIIFPKSIDHIAMARLIGKEVISAGFVSVGTDGMKVYGESYTLDLKSDVEKDQRLLDFMVEN